MDQGSTRKRSAVHNFAPTVTKFCVMWEGQALPHDTKFGNSRCEIVGRRVIFIWSLIHGSSWSGLIKVGPVPNWNKTQQNKTVLIQYITRDMYCQTSDISGSLIVNKNLDCSNACQCCSNYIFILDLPPGCNGLGIDNCKTIWETFEFWDMVWFILEIWPYSICTL